MANEPDTTKSSAMSTVDTVLVIAGVIAAVMVGLWVFHAIVGLVLWFFKIAILLAIIVIVIAVPTGGAGGQPMASSCRQSRRLPADQLLVELYVLGNHPLGREVTLYGRAAS